MNFKLVLVYILIYVTVLLQCCRVEILYTSVPLLNIVCEDYSVIISFDT